MKQTHFYPHRPLKTPAHMRHAFVSLPLCRIVLEHWHQGQSIYNVVNPSHPCKRDYYAQKCQQHGGEMPRFTGTDTAERKVLGSAIEALGFSYQYAI